VLIFFTCVKPRRDMAKVREQDAEARTARKAQLASVADRNAAKFGGSRTAFGDAKAAIGEGAAASAVESMSPRLATEAKKPAGVRGGAASLRSSESSDFENEGSMSKAQRKNQSKSKSGKKAAHSQAPRDFDGVMMLLLLVLVLLLVLLLALLGGPRFLACRRLNIGSTPRVWVFPFAPWGKPPGNEDACWSSPPYSQIHWFLAMKSRVKRPLPAIRMPLVLT